MSEDPPLSRQLLPLGAPPFRIEDAACQGPKRLVLLGPPGTGKTWVTVERFLRPTILRLGLSTPRAVLGCSFTRAAAHEIRSRLWREVLPAGLDEDDLRRCVRTVHSEALRLVREASPEEVVLRAFGDEPSLEDPGVPLWPEEAARDPQAVALRAWDLARHLRQEGGLAAAFALIAPRGVGLAEVRAWSKGYERRKEAEGWRDFTDVLELALDCRPPDRELVLVDEVQDSSPLQWLLFEKWGARAERFVLVGDPDQSVHRWCGARPERLLELSRVFATRSLQESYRVPRSAHRLAVGLIRRNHARVDAPYLPAPSEGRVQWVRHDRGLGSVLNAALGERPCLVLARSRQILSRYAQVLVDAGAPFRHERGYAPLNPSPDLEAAVVLVALRSGQTPARWEPLVRALPGSVISARAAQALFARLSKADDAEPESVLGGLDLRSLVDLPLADALRSLRLGTKSRRLARDLARLVGRHGPEVLSQEPVVVLTTAHGAKGREADVVIVDLEAPKLVERRLESTKEAERQLLYVALTRTRDELILVEHPRRDLGRLLGLGFGATR